eukprot:scaffold304332_cov19-Tisochrysis_lutea.AAC.1
MVDVMSYGAELQVINNFVASASLMLTNHAFKTLRSLFVYCPGAQVFYAGLKVAPASLASPLFAPASPAFHFIAPASLASSF